MWLSVTSETGLFLSGVSTFFDWELSPCDWSSSNSRVPPESFGVTYISTRWAAQLIAVFCGYVVIGCILW